MRFLVSTLFCLLISCGTANAGYFLSFNPTGPVGPTSLPINVDVYLNDTAGVAGDLANYGAVGASFKVNLSGVGALNAPGHLPIGNSLFDAPTFTPTAISATSVTLEEASLFGLHGAGGSLLLGSFTISPTIAGTGSLTIAPFGSFADFSVYDSSSTPNIVDGDVFASPPTFNYTFSAVPEPSSMALLGLAGAGAFGVKFRKRFSWKFGWKKA